jgi:DNA replication and repair protein RecF
MYLSRLTLNHFRNHTFADLELPSGPVVFYGANGAGKTNLLEAISFFSVGRGLRRAKLSDLRPHQTTHSWIMSLVLKDDEGAPVRLSSTMVDDKRLNKIQGDVVKSATAFSEWLSVLWLTPEHDRLFTDAAKVRRRFLDRMVFAYDPLHATRLVNYETSMKERLALLDKTSDDRWLSAIEAQMAEQAVAIAFSRQTLLDRLQAATADLCDLFPKFTCVHKGDFEEQLWDRSAAEWERWFAEQWRHNRGRDREAHMTTVGVHRSDFGVNHPDKGPGDMCSTGEQKILLMGVMLAFLIARLKFDNKLILILLDECVSHFDFNHRVVLFEQILLLHDKDAYSGRLQAIMTGTDKELFQPLYGKAAFFHVMPSDIQKGDSAL